MRTVNRLFKHIIPNDGNDGNVTCCRTPRTPTRHKAAATGQSPIDGQEAHKVMLSSQIRQARPRMSAENVVTDKI